MGGTLSLVPYDTSQSTWFFTRLILFILQFIVLTCDSWMHALLAEKSGYRTILVQPLSSWGYAMSSNIGKTKKSGRDCNRAR